MSPSSSDIVFKGDIPDKAKSLIRKFVDLRDDGVRFASSVGTRLCPKEIELFKRERDGRMQARVVFELKVEPGASHLRHIGAVAASDILPVCAQTWRTGLTASTADARPTS